MNINQSEWRAFQDAYWKLERKRAGGWTPHEKTYNDILLSSETFDEAEDRLEKMSEEYDMTLLSDFYLLFEITVKTIGSM